MIYENRDTVLNLNTKKKRFNLLLKSITIVTATTNNSIIQNNSKNSDNNSGFNSNNNINKSINNSMSVPGC